MNRKKRFYCTIFSIMSAICLLMTWPVTAQNIQNMQLVANQSGWLLASDRLFWTDTQGAQWSEITPSKQSGTAIAGAYFNESGNGWSFQVSSDQTRVLVARTADKGAHWSYSEIASPFGEAASFGGQAYPFFLDAQHGWVMFRLHSSSAFRNGLLFRTVDGGATWTQCPEPPVGGELVFADAQNGWMGPGPQGDELYRTADGGQSWQKVELPDPASSLSAVPSTIELPRFSSSLRGAFLRTYRSDEGATAIRYETDDTGTSWKPTATAVKNAKSTIAALAINGGVTGKIGAQKIGGATALLKSSTASEALPVRASFTNESAGWVLFSGGKCDKSTGVCTQSSALLGTKDGGESFFSLGAIDGIDLEATQTTALPGGTGQTVHALSSTVQPQSSATLQGAMGFDTCVIPTVANMQEWATNSPYKVVGAYIGGVSFGCQSTLPNFTSSWTASVLNQGWEIIPIWVGPQAPDPSKNFSHMMSSDATTAHSEGISEADSAIAALNARGMYQGSPIIYDIEAYTYTNTTYRAATQSFLEGWTTELHAKGYYSGVYSSRPEFKYWYPTSVTPATDIIWFAYFFSSGVACGTDCQTVFPTNTSFDIDASYWTNHHRMRQTSSGFKSTYGSLTYNIDEDWIDAAMVVNNPNTLTAAKSGTGTGTIASTTIGSTTNSDTASFTQIACGSTCTAKLAATDIITLQATADSGSSFTGWAGCDSASSNVCTVTVSASKTVAATFTAATTTPTAAMPTFSPVGGTYSSAQTVTISSATTGATIYYTTNGSTPTTASTAYSAPIAVNSTETINAIAVLSGYNNSTVATATYTITLPTVATPTFTPAAGTYASAQSVTIGSTTAGATIHYTTDGSTPTASSTQYSSAIAVSSTTTIKAIAVLSGYTNSAVSSATYTITTPTVTPTASSSSLTIMQGQSGTTTLTLTPTGTYSGTLSFTCSGLPSYATCSFSPATLAFSASSTAQTTTVTIATTTTSAQVQRSSTALWAFLLPIFLAPLALSRKARKFRGMMLALLVAGSLGLAGLVGCGGGSGSSSSTAFSGTVYVNVASTASSTTVQVPITLKITK